MMTKSLLKFLRWHLLLLWGLTAAPRPAWAQAPAFDWAEGFDGTITECNVTAVDGAGNVYIAGRFFQSATIGPFQVTAPYYGVYMARRAASGSWQWAVAIPDAESVKGLTVDSAGNAYLTGEFQTPNLRIGSTTLANQIPSGYFYDIFVAKISPNSTWQWAASGGSSYTDSVTGIAVSSAGNVYVAGYINE